MVLVKMLYMVIQVLKKLQSLRLLLPQEEQLAMLNIGIIRIILLSDYYLLFLKKKIV